MGSTYPGTPDYFGQEAPLVDLNELPSWLLHEDDDLLVFNKPGWLVCHPSKNGPLSSLVGAAREYTGLERIHLVSRLDRETSGVVILAKRPAIARQLQGAIEKQQADKVYLALLRGELEGPLHVNAPLGRDKHSLVHVKQAVREDGAGKSAETLFEPIFAANGYTLARVQIRTGRKHQIRAHALHICHHVAGDKIYGPDDLLYLDFIDDGWTPRHEELLEMRRQVLHAWKLTVYSGAGDFSFTAPLPLDMSELARDKLGSLPEIE